MTKRRGFQAGKCLREEEPTSTELPSTSFPSTSSSLPPVDNGSNHFGSGNESTGGSNSGYMSGSGEGSDFESGSSVLSNSTGNMEGAASGEGGVIQSSTAPGQKWITATLG